MLHTVNILIHVYSHEPHADRRVHPLSLRAAKASPLPCADMFTSVDILYHSNHSVSLKKRSRL